MFKNIFLILLLAHILGDFYFQSENLAKSKNKSFHKLLIHSSIYALICFVINIIITNEWMIVVTIISASTHFIIDIIKYFYIKKHKGNNNYSNNKDSILYSVDQVIHIISFVIISLIVTFNYSSFNILKIIDEIFMLAEISLYQVFKWVLIILIIGKPANITIKRLLSSFKPLVNNKKISKIIIKEKKPDLKSEVTTTDDRLQIDMPNDEKRAGALIGFLERLIIVIFLLINQYSAIGLVLTAKSIARYDKISKDQAFAEYYLLGTLLSSVIAIVTYFLVM